MSEGNSKNESKKCNHGKKVNILINIKGRKSQIKSGGCKSKRAKVPKGKKSRFCYDHGCQSCFFENPKTTTASSGVECCEKCKSKLETKKTQRDSYQEKINQERNTKINEFKTKNEQLANDIKNIFPDFWEWVVKKAEEKLVDLVQKSIREEINLAPNGFYNKSCRYIDRLTSLKVEERDKLKEIYYKLFIEHLTMNEFFSLKTNLLKLLVQKYKTSQEKRDQEQAIPKCNNCHFRRQQPTTFPDGCEGWCQECIEQQKRKDENPETPLPTPPEKDPDPFPTPPNNELSSTKQGIQIKYNLDLAEFNLVLEPITDLEVLEAVDKLVGKVKMGTQDTDLDSLYEILRAYQQATDGSLKNKAYLAVNSYQQQVDQLISSLETKKNKRKSSLQELVQAKDETELNQVYQAIKEDPELYQAQNQNLIDNHQKRVVGALQIMVQNPTNGLAQELVTTLRTIVASDSDQDDLINLAQKIKEYQTAHGGEKEELYQQHHSVIDQMEQEIQTELTRRQQSEEEQRDKPSPSPSTTSQPASGKGLALFLLGLGGIATLLVLSYLYKKKKKTVF